MNKKKSFLGLCLIISFVIIIAAVVVSLTAGINMGSDIGGGTQLEITIDGNVASKNTIETVKDVLKDNGTVAESIFVEDKHLDSLIVVRIADKKVENQSQIKADLVEKLGVSLEDISSFNTFGGTVTKKAVLYTGITIVCLLLFIFVVGWIRYTVVAGLSLMFTLLHSLMLAVSLFVLSRVPITMVSLIEILCVEAALLLAFVLFLEKIRANEKMKHNENLSTAELVGVSQKAVLKPLIFLAALSLVVSLVMVCVPVRFVTLSACGMMVSIVSGIYSYYFIGVQMHERLLDLKVSADKLRLSRNVPPEPQKVKENKKAEVKK